MVIAVLIYSMSGGGAERVVSYLLPYLKKKGHTVHLILMNTSKGYSLPEDITVHYIERSSAFENGLFKFLKLPILAFKYAKMLKKLKITHSFSLLTRPNYINILVKRFAVRHPKIIISERAHPSLQYGYGNTQSKINNRLIKILYPKADFIICNSKGNAEDLIYNYHIPKNKIEVIYNPIDLVAIKEKKAITDFFDEAFCNMVTVGRMDSGKNHVLLINAIKKFKNVRLYILGTGVLKEYLSNLTQELQLEERVHFLGFDPNPYQYLKSADLFIFGSNHEGFPNVLLEAMACGLPILTTNCKSGPDEIMELQQSFENDIMKTPYGILTPVDDVDLMSKGMAYFIQNPEYVQSCREKVLERIKAFDKEGILKAYESALSRQ